MTVIEVVDGGPLTTLQDPVGRRGWRHLGVPVGGAADAWSARLANRLAGNADDAAVLEMTLAGATLRFDASSVIGLAGGLEATVDGLPMERGSARQVRAGAVLRVGSGSGARGYVAVGGGIAVAPVLGSPSTDLRTGFGGYAGRALRAGDRLETAAPRGGPRRWIGRDPFGNGPIRVTSGPQAADLLAALEARAFTVGPNADRAGVRLAESLPGGGETSSMGLPLGAIQVPPDGLPIVMLADRPVTGGYVVPAVVIAADVGRVAQLRPGDAIRFTSVGLEEARAAWRRADEELAALEPLDAEPDDELGWSGSHR